MVRKQVDYIVLQEEDITKYLSDEQKIKFEEIRATIYMGRRQDQKPSRSFIVVNWQEPYADAVWNIVLSFEEMKKKTEQEAMGKEEQ